MDKLRYTVVGLTAMLLSCSPTLNAPEANEPLVTPIGAPQGAPVIQTIGSAGGTLTTPDGRLTITVPAGAVTTDTQFTLQPTVNTINAGVGPGFKLLPANLELAQPLRVNMILKVSDLKGAPVESVGLGVQDSAGRWYASSDEAAPSNLKNVVSSQSNDEVPLPTLTLPKAKDKTFENIALYLGANLTPTSASVAKGKSLRFQLSGLGTCPPPTPTNSEEAPLPSLCFFPRPLINATAGTLKAVGESRTEFEYTAPTSIPAQNPVGLTFTFKNVGKNGKSEILLAASVKIIDEDLITGTFRSTTTFQKVGSTAAYNIEFSGIATLKYVEGISGKGYESLEGTMNVGAYTVVSKGKKSTTVCDTDAAEYKIRFLFADETKHAIQLSDDGTNHQALFSVVPLSDQEPKPKTVCTTKDENGNVTNTTTFSRFDYPRFLSQEIPISSDGALIGEAKFTDTGLLGTPTYTSSWIFKR
jgi:hypothetical protein